MFLFYATLAKRWKIMRITFVNLFIVYAILQSFDENLDKWETIEIESPMNQLTFRPLV